ncbi:zinc finger protein 518A-like [Arapaima gigas]
MSSPGKDQGFSELLTDGPETDSSHGLPLNDRNRTPDDSFMLNSQECHNGEESEHLPFNSDPLMEKVPDSEIEVDECVATVDEECNGMGLFSDLGQRPHSTPKRTLQDEEKQSFLLCRDTCVSDSAFEHQNSTPEKKIDVSLMQKVRGSSCSAAALGRILEEHSDAIISQQLEKERTGTTVAHDALRSPTTTLRILQSFNVAEGIKTSGSSRVPMHAPVTVPQPKNLSSSAPLQGKAGEKEGLNNKLKRVRLPPPRSNHQSAKRKRQQKSQTEGCLEPASKAKRHSSKKCKEKEASPAAVCWEPMPREAERTLRLSPFCPAQLIKCPRRNQPVIVLNHPDVDIPEVTNIMRMVNKYKGEVLKVALSQRTIEALSELNRGTFKTSRSPPCQSTHGQRTLGESTARERFILKLKLKKTSRNKYKVVNTTSDSAEQMLSFSCWFCGRIFDNQEEWIGHGQRHLMEATRDWNKLF